MVTEDGKADDLGIRMPRMKKEHLREWRRAAEGIQWREASEAPIDTGAATATESADGSWEVAGRPGLPWCRGLLRLEHHPDLSPLKARGCGTDPGELWRLRNIPQVAAAVDDTVGNIATAPWGIEKPEIPAWQQNDPLATFWRDVQWEIQQRAWHSWTESCPDYDLLRMHTDWIQFAMVSGFSWGELSADLHTMPMGDLGMATVPLLNLPEFRAPWTVSGWVLQNERPRAVIQRLPYQYSGGVAIPWEHVCHFTLHEAGPSDLEGYSSLRPAVEAIKALIDIYRLQALACEVNALGTWVGTPMDPTRGGDPTVALELRDHFKNYIAEHIPFVINDAYKVELLSPQDAVPDFTAQAAIYERLIGYALNQSHKLLGLLKHGSFAAREAAGQEALDAYTLPLERVARKTRWLLRRAVEVAFPSAVAEGYLYVAPVRYAAPMDAEDEQPEPMEPAE
jgi:hypothetical protein